MTKITQILLISLFTITSLMAQSIIVEKYNEGTKKNTYIIDAHKYLAESDKMVAEYLKNNPNYFEEIKLQKKTAWNFEVGSTKNWFASDFTAEIASDQIYEVPSTCRAVGTTCYIFVEDAIWNSRVSQENVDAVVNAFDNSTPANSNKGIYNTVVETFGTPPDVDGDPKVIILILDIRDGFSGSGGYTAGYFHSLNEINQTGSNMAEMYYMDANPADLSTDDGLNGVLATMAHEFQHMIHFNYHNGTEGKLEQITFFNEGCSEVAEVVCGYPIRNQNLFNNEYNHYLLDWRDDKDLVLNDYTRASRYFTYMYEQFGADFLKNFVKNYWPGILGIKDALSSLPTELTFESSLINWFTSNVLNDRNINSAWGYSTPNVGVVNAPVYRNPNYSSPTIAVELLAADYFSFSDIKDLSIQFDDSKRNRLIIKAFKYDINNNVVIDSLIPNTLYSYSNFESNYRKITFGVFNNSPSSSFSYSYTATGNGGDAITLAYDENPPTGVLPLSNNDTVCVVFDGIPGGKLDSISVALRQAGSVHGGIYKYTGETRPTPLGTPLLSDLTVTSNIAERPVYNEDAQSYPVPFPNWITVDLTNENIDAGNPFVAAFLVEGTYPANNRIMISEQSEINNHSYSYLHNPSSDSPDWYYLTPSEGNVYVYLIRAFVSTGVTDVEEQTVELLPSNFELKQNYPNPFNPNTNISFSLPNNSFVDLAVYNSLGEKVSTLVNKDLSAGSYSFDFDGAGLASGIYYYKLISGSFVETKKMILMK